MVRPAQRIILQLTEAAMPRELFFAILGQVSELRLMPG